MPRTQIAEKKRSLRKWERRARTETATLSKTLKHIAWLHTVIAQLQEEKRQNGTKRDSR